MADLLAEAGNQREEVAHHCDSDDPRVRDAIACLAQNVPSRLVCALGLDGRAQADLGETLRQLTAPVSAPAPAGP
jgi:hypothetical protein